MTLFFFLFFFVEEIRLFISILNREFKISQFQQRLVTVAAFYSLTLESAQSNKQLAKIK